MNKQEILDAYNHLNNAFSNYMVGDMNTPRCNYIDESGDEAQFGLWHEGQLLARKLLMYNADSDMIKNCIRILINHSENNDEPSFKIDGNEGDTYDSKKLIQNLCLCYQLDENRPDYIKSYVNGFLSYLIGINL